MGAKQLPAELAAEAAGCAAKGLVLFLNETGCAYQYDPAQTSEEEHLSAQDLCLEGVDYEGNAKRIVSACLDANSP